MTGVVKRGQMGMGGDMKMDTFCKLTIVMLWKKMMCSCFIFHDLGACHVGISSTKVVVSSLIRGRSHGSHFYWLCSYQIISL